MRLNSLKELYLEQLRDAYDAEKVLVKALPKMAKAASTPQLQAAFEEHLAETRTQVQRLERIFATMGQEPKAKKCLGLRGIIDEGDDMINADGDVVVRDAGLIAGAQMAGHYEIALYGTLKAWAEQLGERIAVELLNETLEEEKASDRKLTQIAESSVNQQALRRVA